MATKPKGPRIKYVPEFGPNNEYEVLLVPQALATDSFATCRGETYLKGSRPQPDGSWVYFKSSGEDVTDEVEMGPQA